MIDLKPQHDFRARPLSSVAPDVERRIHPSAVVPASTLAACWDYCRILADVVMGEHCSVGGGTEIGRGSTVGDHSRIGANVFLPSNSRIGQYVFIGPNVTCTDDRYPRVPVPGDPPYDARPPIIEDGASVGAGAVILPGIRIGPGAKVAAGAIVTKDVAAGVIVMGEAAQVHAGSAEAAKRGWAPKPVALNA